MPGVTSGRVLVTGANGYVAVWVLKYLLERSFIVRGTVRSESKGTYLKELFKEHGDRLEISIVPDITQTEAFDTAAQDVDAILHIASPVILDADDPNDVIVPAVLGTSSILGSALKHRATVKRVVITSSVAAIANPLAPGEAPRMLNEEDWNQVSVKEVEAKGRAAPSMHKYRASKVLAERTAWEFWEREKRKLSQELGEELGWDLVVLNPPFVYGPFIHEAPTLQALGGTARQWYDHVVEGDLSGDALLKEGFDWVDVRDVAHAEVLSLITPAAGGERLIIRGGSYVWQKFINAARRFSDKIPPGDVKAYDPAKICQANSYTSEKGQRILGIRYRTLEETTKDTIEDFQARGWVQ
ncbi:D-lactaldehyde dehydrogenase [Trametes gibbosa]|nr:D-lactaldehyde dehydrogenase [Trametes gibbosa]